MQILQNITPATPSVSYTLNLSSDEMRVLRQALNYVDVPHMPLEDRQPFWTLYQEVVFVT